MVREADLVMITAGHSNVDYAMVQQNAKLIFDTKNITRIKGVLGDNIEIL